MSDSYSFDAGGAPVARHRTATWAGPLRLVVAGLGALAFGLAACATAPPPHPDAACVPAPVSVTFAVDDSGGLLPAGSAALGADLAGRLRAGDEFGVVRLSGRRGLPVTRVPGAPCSDVAPRRDTPAGVVIGDGADAQMTAVAQLQAEDAAAAAAAAVEGWKREVRADLEVLAGGPLQADHSTTDDTGACAQDGWPAGPLSRVRFAGAPYRSVLVLSGCQAQYTPEQPKLPTGILAGITVLVVDAVGPVDASAWFGATGARVVVIPANRRADVAGALDNVRHAPLPVAYADLASADEASLLAGDAVLPFLSMASRMGDTILLAALGLLAGLAVLAVYGTLGAIFLDPILFIRDGCVAGVRAVLRWGRGLTARLRTSDPWRMAESLRSRASGTGDIAEDILQAAVLAASTVTGFLLIAVGAGLVGMHVIPGVRTALPYVLGGTLVLGAAFAFHHLRHGPPAERKWALAAVGLSIVSGLLIAAAKGADLRAQEGLREALLARSDYQPSALVSFLRGFAPNAFILVASAQVITVAALTDFRVVGRGTAFVAGSLLAGLTLVPALIYYAAFGLPAAALLGSVSAPFALLAVFPAEIREWIMLLWGRRSGQSLQAATPDGIAEVLAPVQSLLPETTPSTKREVAEKGDLPAVVAPDQVPPLGIF